MSKLTTILKRIFAKHYDPITGASEGLPIGFGSVKADGVRLSRYILASRLAKGMVLDLGFGTCYESSILRRGYKIVQNVRAVSYHHTRQVSKKLSHLSMNPEHLRGLNESEVYFIVKNINMLGSCSTLLHVVYRILESIAWALRTRRPSTLIYGVAGIIEGLAKRLMFKWQTN